MAHNLNQKEDGTYAFAAVGEVAWHGLGTYVQEAMTAEKAIELGGIDYEVKKKKIQVCGDKVIPGFFATQRQDTKDVLGIVSGDYEVFQNKEAFGFFDSFIDKGEAIYHTVGALGLGERIFLSAKLPEDIFVNGETVQMYILLTTGHNGKAPLQIGFTPIRVVCNNTLSLALKDLQNKITILHFQDMRSKVAAAAKMMGIASKYTQELEGHFNKMATVKIDDPALRSYIEMVMMPAKKEIITPEDFSKQFVKKVDSIFEFAHEHETQQTDAAKGTVFGAYNSISGYYNFLKEYKTQDMKMKDLYFGEAETKVKKAFTAAMEIAGAN